MIVSQNRFQYTHTPSEVREDFEQLRRMDPEQLVDTHAKWSMRCSPKSRLLWLYPQIRRGQQLAEYHHWRHRVRTATSSQPSGTTVLERWKKGKLSAALKRTRRTSPKSTHEKQLYHLIETNSALQTVTHFRAFVARHLCWWTQARSVLDFSAGWGDRLTGFLASDDTVRTITLIDPRPTSIRECIRQHAFVKSTQTLHTYTRPAEDVLPTLRASSVDLIVTSPPYWNIERYGVDAHDMRGQIHARASSLEEYLKTFLYPVLNHCARILAPGGVLAINVDDNERLGVFLCEPTLQRLRRDKRLRELGVAGLRKSIGFGRGTWSSKQPHQTRAEPIFLFQRSNK